MNPYPLLAHALLKHGDSTASVVSFLRNEYGLNRDQAKAALVLARYLEDETDASRRQNRPRH